MSNVQLVQESNSIWTTVEDELTATAVPDLQGKLKQALAKDARDIVFDLQHVRTIDSAGIGLLLAAKNSVVARQGSLRLVNVPCTVFTLLNSMRLVDSLGAERASRDAESDLEQCFERTQTA